MGFRPFIMQTKVDGKGTAIDQGVGIFKTVQERYVHA